MDNQGQDFPGGPPPRRNNTARGGSGLPNNLFPSSLGSIDPQYAAALDFEELRIRHQLEVQQDIELRRRLMEEQQHQLMSELEYRNQMQQLQELQELQAHQQQQHDLSQLLAQNPQLLDLHQQQQYHSLRDDLLLHRHQFVLQDHMQHQLQEDSQHHQLQEQLSRQLSRESEQQQQEQEDFLAMLQASGNLTGVLPTNVSALRQEETIGHQPPDAALPVQMKAPPPESISVQLEERQVLHNLSRQGVDSTPTNQRHACSHDNTNHSESLDITCRSPLQDPPTEMQNKRATGSSPMIPPYSKDAKSKEEESPEKSARNKELDDKVAKLLESQKLPALTHPTKKKKDKGASEEKRNKKKGEMDESPTKNGVSGKKKTKKGRERDDGNNKMSDQENNVIDLLGSGASENEKLKMTEMIGVDQSCPKKIEELEEVREHTDSKALEILFDFKRADVSAGEVHNVRKWSREKQTLAAISSSVQSERLPSLKSGIQFGVPSLPTEPEVKDLELSNRCLMTHNNPVDIDNIDKGKEVGLLKNDKGGAFIGNKTKMLQRKRARKGQDGWWPSSASIRKERRKCSQHQNVEDTDEEINTAEDLSRGISFLKAGIEAAKDRLATSVEPGVLEKLPYCKLYDDYCKERGNEDCAPKFCCQTTETFPYETMVCCSVCSTWRHAQCGGHYKRYTPDSVDPSNVLFRAICDRCFIEKQYVDDKDVAAARLQRQRIEHLRLCNASNAVMRQVAFGKHSGQYKWPLGSVHVSRISGHIRSVQTRHEKVEKQWNEMTHRLGNRHELRPRERQRLRTREFERLLVSIEDAEGAMDRHNMMLFLQSDTSKLHPAGFEFPRRNIFEPKEDPANDHEQTDSAKSLESFDKIHSDLKAKRASCSADIIKEEDARSSGMKELTINSTDENIAKHRRDEHASKTRSYCACYLQGCDKKSRFDSIFCSDSCGVSTLETDVLRSLQYADKLHPSLLRS